MKNIFLGQKYIQQFLALLLLGAGLCSCEKLIEIDLPNNQINTKDVFNDHATAQSVLYNLYINIRENHLFRGGSLGLSCNLDLYTDNIISFAQHNPFYQNTISPYSLNDLRSFWNQPFSDIFHINSFIEGVNKSSNIPLDKKNLFLGEGYLMRALYYQYLSQLYGSMPYINSTNYKKNNKLAKSSYEEVLQYIKDDLSNALKLLPEDYRHSERIYLNRSVAKLLLSKNYLLQKQYVDAEKLSQKLIDNPLYTLEQNIDLTFKKNAKSTLWQISMETYATYDATSYIFTSLPPTNYALSSGLVNSFDASDLRKANWIKEVTDGTTSYYHAYKYKNKENNTDEYSILFRIEEAYFVLMEALAYQNRIPEAIGYLNTIRNRAGLDDLPDTLSQTGFIDAMLEESRREFFTEGGHRFFDLKRNNRLHILKEVKPNWEDKHALFPIPESEILLNPNLLPQNEGY